MLSELAPETSAQVAKRTLLVVDDEEGPRQSLWAIFKDDYEVLLAESAAQALEIIRDRPVDAAVLDIRMPDMSGTELLQHCKRIDPAVEVIMLTAYQTVDTARIALRHGACEYLTKPFDISTMSAAVANAMERRAVTEQIRLRAQKLRELQNEIQNQRLRSEMASKKGEIYASILHDINNPITVISGLIDMIQRQIADATRVEGTKLATMKERLGQTNRQLANCIQISRRYLSFLKPRPPLEQSVAVNQILADVNELLKHHPSRNQNRLRIQPLAQDTVVAMNGIDLVQILLNLAVNALQCTEQSHLVEIGGSILSQPLQAKQLADGPSSRWLNLDGFDCEASLVELTVRDDGPGMPEPVLKRLFEPYFTTRAGAQGTGLGLSIVHRLIKEARGALFVRSEAGQGTLFRLFLPGRPPGVRTSSAAEER